MWQMCRASCVYDSGHQAVLRQPDIVPVYNVGYSPEFNAIKTVFSKVKAHYNRQRLNCLINKTFFRP